ncbi:MAG: carboxypeptidase-like regulatory domain-containing protein, partial [Ignavibacteria bacterium]
MYIWYSPVNFLKILLLSFFIISYSLAQGSGMLRGKVYDKTTKEGLPGANLIVKSSSVGAATDIDGNYVMRGVPAGKQTIIVTYIGYEVETVVLTITSGSTLQKDFGLEFTTLEGEEVVVTAQAQGQLEAINQQLASDKIANIVSESKIQELPDFNAAATLSRLPGISTTQSSGEDNKVVIRGLSPKYNSIEVEGVRLSATGSSQIGLSSNPEIALQDISNDRSVDLTMISPYMIRMISVYKSLTPDMNANSIGGTVNMELREAPPDLHYDLLYQQGFTAKSNTYGNYRAIASGSYRFLNNKLGAYALFNIESYDRNSDNFEAGYDITAGQADVDPVTGYRPVEVNTVTFNRHIETRKRYGGNLILDYALPRGSIKLTNLLARINSDYLEHRQVIDYDQGRMNWRLNDNENNIDQRLHSLKFNYDLGILTADLSASYTTSNNVLEKSPQISFNQTDAVQAGVFRDNVNPENLTYLLPTFGQDSAVVLRSGNLLSSDYKEDLYTYKADFQIPFNISSGASGFFKVGGQYNNQKNS